MFIYVIVVLSVVAVLTAILAFVFRKKRLLDFRTLLAVAFGSLLAGVIFPLTYNLVLMRLRVYGDNNGFIPTLAITMLVYMLLALVLSAAAAYMFPLGRQADPTTGVGTEDTGFDSTQDTGFDSTQDTGIDSTQNTGKNIETGGVGMENGSKAGNYLEEIFDSHLIGIKEEESEQSLDEGLKEEGGADTPAAEEELETLDNIENNFEKSVDSDKNIDKMGIEIYQQDQNHDEALEKLSIDDCVDEAFRLKESGDLEGAILYYMYALDRKPARDLVFWIVLDICVLYRELGQLELARDILSNYSESFGDLMDLSVKAEIERNLSSIQE